MKKITLSIFAAIMFTVIMISPTRANACFNDCYGYAEPSYYVSNSGYNYSYRNYSTYYSPSYYVSNSGYNYSYGGYATYNSPTYYNNNHPTYYPPYESNPQPTRP